MYLSNFKQHWKEHIAHVGVGILGGYLLTHGYEVGGLTLMGFVAVRQGLEYLKRKDTPGIDMAYHIGGMLVGLLTGVAGVI